MGISVTRLNKKGLQFSLLILNTLPSLHRRQFNNPVAKTMGQDPDCLVRIQFCCLLAMWPGASYGLAMGLAMTPCPSFQNCKTEMVLILASVSEMMLITAPTS